MSDRRNFYYRQKVTEAELDGAFDALELAQQRLAIDHGLVGIASGMAVGQHTPNNLTVDVTAGTAYDEAGQRVRVPTTQNVNVALDNGGVTTAVTTPGNSKVVSLFVKFKRSLSDPRIDGNSATVYFVSEESFEFYVKQGVEATTGTEVAPGLEADKILLADIKRTQGVTTITNAEINSYATNRRQDMFVDEGGAPYDLRAGTVQGVASALLSIANDVAGDIGDLQTDVTALEAADVALQAQVAQQCGLRLSLTTAEPVPTADVSGTDEIFLTPYLSGQIRLYTSSVWTVRTTAEISITFSGLTTDTNYDVFAYWDGAAVQLELSAAWASDSARTDALALQDGVLVKSGDATRLFVGTFRTTGAATTEDSVTKRYLWNYFNRVTRHLVVNDNTSSWTYVNPNQVWRQARADAANKVGFVCGAPTPASAFVKAVGYSTTGSNSVQAVGVGIDSTTVNSAQLFGGPTFTSSTPVLCLAQYRGCLAAGFHELVWLETGQSGALTYTFRGNNGSSIDFTGMLAEIAA